MADSKISALTNGSPAVATDQIPINRGGTNYRINAGTIAAPGPGFFNALNYGAVADNSTDNATAFAALATAVNAYAVPTVNTQAMSVVVYFPAGAYVYSSGLVFTQPVVLMGDSRGASILNYSGSGKAVELGPTGLTNSTFHSGEYIVQNLTFTGGITMTYGIYFNTFLVRCRVLNCSFRNFGNSTTSVWAVYFSGDGSNWDCMVFGNSVQNDDNTARNFCKVAATGNQNSQLHFINNFMSNLAASHSILTPSAANSGTGLHVSGTGSLITNNNFNFFNPMVHVSGLCRHTKIINNYSEAPQDAADKPIVEFDTISNLIIDGLYTDLHGGSYVVGPAGGALISNSLIQNIYVAENINGGELIHLNNTAGQTGNTYFNLQAEHSFIPTTTGVNIDAWKAVQTA